MAFFTASSSRSGLIEDNPPGSWSFLSRNFASAAALFVARGPPGWANLNQKQKIKTPEIEAISMKKKGQKKKKQQFVRQIANH